MRVILWLLARKTGGYLHFPAVCTYCWKADSEHHGSKEPEENGRWRLIR